MEEIKISKKYGTLVGKVLSSQKTSGSLSTALAYIPDNAQEKNYGSLYFVIELEDAGGRVNEIAYTIMDIIKAEFYNNLRRKPRVSFEHAMQKVNTKMVELANGGEVAWLGKINATVSCITGNELFVVQEGSAEIHLVRDRKIIALSEPIEESEDSAPNPEDVFTDLVAGELLPGDKLVFSTAELFYYLSLEKLRSIVSENSTNEAAGKVAEILGANEGINKTSLLVVEFNTKANLKSAAGEDEQGADGDDTGEENIFTPEMLEAGLIEDEEETADVTEIVKKSKPTGDNIRQGLRRGLASVTASAGKMGSTIRKQTKVDERLAKAGEAVRGKLQSGRAQNSEATERFSQKILRTLIIALDAFITFLTIQIVHLKKRRYGHTVFLGLMALVVVLFVWGIFAFANGQRARVSLATARNAIEQALIKENEAKAALIYDDTDKASEALSEAYALLTPALSNDNTKVEAETLLFTLQQKLDEVTNTQRFGEELAPKIDLNVLAPQLNTIVTNSEAVEVSADRLVFANSNIYVIDGKNNKIYGYDPVENKAQIANGLASSTRRLVEATIFDSETMLISGNPARIYKYDLNNNFLSTAETSDLRWADADAMATFGANIYLMDKNENEVWRYRSNAGDEDAEELLFGDPEAYFSEDVDLSNAISMAIDGSVYILRADGQIEKYLSGSRGAFELRGLPAPATSLNKPTKLYTSSTLNSLFVLDSGHKRILEIAPSGDYVGQYVFEFENINDFYVTSSRIYLLSGTKLYQVSR